MRYRRDCRGPNRGTGRLVFLEELDTLVGRIEGKVYDISAYIPEHPTPASVLTSWCGKEATEGMRTKGYGRDHSPTAWRMLDDYLVGDLAGGK